MNSESKAKHTAGPWRAVTPAGYGKDTLIMSGTDIVASLVRFEDKAANARLIAASPEMYEMLKRCQRWIQSCNEYAGILNELEELIKKIEG